MTPTGTHFFDIYRIEDLGLDTSEAILSVPLGVDFGTTDLDVLDIDADGRWELVALWKGRRQWYVSTFQLPGSGEPSEAWQAKLLSTTRIVLPSGQTPVRLSSLQIADPVGAPRPAVCIVTAETL